MITGFDISSFQAALDISLIPKPGFVIIKATQGNSYVNPYWRKQYDSAKARGLLIGLYHYVTGDAGEIDHFLSQVKDVSSNARLCLDWESNQNHAFGDHEYIKQAAEYLQSLSPNDIALYCSDSVRDQLPAGYGQWIAHYGVSTMPKSCIIWQFTSSYRLPGYAANLDCNRTILTADNWLHKFAGYKVPVVSPAKTPLTVDQLAWNVIRGEYGNGDARVAKLKSLGADPIAVQKRVNALVADTAVAKPAAAKLYTVKAGDTLSSLAKKFNTTVEAIAKTNGISNVNLIRIGQVLKV